MVLCTSEKENNSGEIITLDDGESTLPPRVYLPQSSSLSTHEAGAWQSALIVSRYLPIAELS
jgi:hypothetical protein